MLVSIMYMAAIIEKVDIDERMVKRNYNCVVRFDVLVKDFYDVV